MDKWLESRELPNHLVAACGLVRRDGRVLLIRNRLRGWELPGGTMEQGETVTEALKREIYEESGILCEPEQLAGVYQNLTLKDGYGPLEGMKVPPVVNLAFLCRYTGGEPSVSDEAEDVRWVSPEEAVRMVTHPLYAKRLADLLEAGEAVVFSSYEYDNRTAVFRTEERLPGARPARSAERAGNPVQAPAEGGKSDRKDVIGMRRIFFISGPCGSGKTTFSDAWAKHLVSREGRPVYLIHGDDFHRGFVEPEDKPDFFAGGQAADRVLWEDILRFNWDCILATADRALRQDLDVVIDYVIEEELPRVTELAAKHRAALYYIVLTADAEELERRIRGRGDTDMVERALFLKRKLEAMPENRGHLYNNTGKTVGGMIGEIRPEQYQVGGSAEGGAS